MYQSSKLYQSFHRHGVTLVELLIVMGILTILATLSLTTVKGLLKDQKVTQSARLVEQYIETARVRAITNRRPVAVFLERVGLEGDANNGPLPANYTTTRLSIGEVFPPYVGDVLDAKGELWDVDFTAVRASRIADGFADQIRLPAGSVLSGFGTTASPGMISVGDTIEFVGHNVRFVIEAINYIPAADCRSGVPEVAITFFNPPTPATYNLGGPPYSTREPDLPTAGTVTGVAGATTAIAVTVPSVGFRVFRKPTKSLVGAVTLPRGTCIDLYASGVGPRSSTADNYLASGSSTPTPFLTKSGHPTLAGLAPAAGIVTPPLARSSFSRVAILFDAAGRPSGIFRDDKIIDASGTVASNGFFAFELSSVLHLLVGRSAQVSLGGLDRPAAGERDESRANILDPGNVWISINPMTGLISSSPVSTVADDTLSAILADGVVSDAEYAGVVSQARALATAGVSNAGK